MGSGRKVMQRSKSARSLMLKPAQAKEMQEAIAQEGEKMQQEQNKNSSDITALSRAEAIARLRAEASAMSSISKREEEDSAGSGKKKSHHKRTSSKPKAVEPSSSTTDIKRRSKASASPNSSAGSGQLDQLSSDLDAKLAALEARFGKK